MKQYNPSQPVVLGLSGEALTGKTCTADRFAMPISASWSTSFEAVQTPGIQSPPLLQWDHLYYALPLYRMAGARAKMTGASAQDRFLYEVHETLLDIFGKSPLFGAPPYHQLIQMVKDIAALPFPADGSKPRTFLQKAGTEICRGYDDQCFVKWMKRKLVERQFEFTREQEREMDDPDMLDVVPKAFAIVISDIRFRNEAALVEEHPNGVLVKLTASEEVRQERSLNRDGRTMDESQRGHASELGIKDIPQDWGVTLDTDSLSVQEQVLATRKILYTQLQGLPDA